MSDSQPQNWLDRTIETIAPGWALKRAAARTSLGEFRRFESSYRGGVSTRVDSGWSRQGSITGQMQADRYRLASMRDRSRNVDQNNPIGHGMLNRLVDNVVGEGFKFDAATKDAAFDQEATERWQEWWDQADIRGLMSGPELERQLFRAHCRDGDVGMVLVDRGGQSRVQLIEADQIATPLGKTNADNLIDGVEMDRVGKPTTFHVRTVTEYGGKWEDTPVPADNFVFFPRFKRFNAIRGEPCFSQIFPLLDQIDGYIDAVVIAARMAAIFGLIFKENNAGKNFSLLGNATNGAGQLQKAITLENGQLKYQGQADSVVQVQAQQPMQQTPEFIASMLRLIGLPLDMPLEMVLLDFSRVNYSSARASFLNFYRSMRPIQDYFRRRVLSRTYRWWISRERKRQEIGDSGAFVSKFPEKFWPHKFLPRGWQWVDPVKEATGHLMEINMGVNTRRRVAAGLGRDYDEIVAELAAEAAALRSMGIPPIYSVMTRDNPDESINQPAKPPAYVEDEDEDS